MTDVTPQTPGQLNSITNIPEAEYRSILGEAIACGTGSTDVMRAKWQGRFVAIKRFDKRKHMTEERILNEITILIKCIGHPNVVQLLAAGPNFPKQCTFHVTEYADFQSLDKVLHHSHQISYTLAHAVSWALQAAKGLDFLHRTCVPPQCHGDLKPANMLLFDGGVRLKLADFGATGSLGREDTRRPATLVYTAPEIAFIRTGMELMYTTQSDVYSWTVSFWEMLARQRPYEYGSDIPKATYWSVFGSRLPAFRKCPDDLRLICDRGLAANSELRPAAEHLVAILNFVLNKILLRNASLTSLNLAENVVTESSGDAS